MSNSRKFDLDLKTALATLEAFVKKSPGDSLRLVTNRSTANGAETLVIRIDRVIETAPTQVLLPEGEVRVR